MAYARGELTPVHNNDDEQLLAVQPAAPSKRDSQQHNDRQPTVRKLLLPNIYGISAARMTLQKSSSNVVLTVGNSKRLD